MKNLKLKVSEERKILNHIVKNMYLQLINKSVKI